MPAAGEKILGFLPSYYAFPLWFLHVSASFELIFKAKMYNSKSVSVSSPNANGLDLSQSRKGGRGVKSGKVIFQTSEENHTLCGNVDPLAPTAIEYNAIRG